MNLLDWVRDHREDCCKKGIRLVMLVFSQAEESLILAAIGNLPEHSWTAKPLAVEGVRIRFDSRVTPSRMLMRADRQVKDSEVWDE